MIQTQGQPLKNKKDVVMIRGDENTESYSFFKEIGKKLAEDKKILRQKEQVEKSYAGLGRRPRG